jgi:hypothetical protein
MLEWDFLRAPLLHKAEIKDKEMTIQQGDFSNNQRGPLVIE